jgi:hypothetical protein
MQPHIEEEVQGFMADIAGCILFSSSGASGNQS